MQPAQSNDVIFKEENLNLFKEIRSREMMYRKIQLGSKRHLLHIERLKSYLSVIYEI